MTFDGVVGQPLSDMAKYGELRGPGPVTQVAIFERVADAAAHQAAFADAAGMNIVWSSEAPSDREVNDHVPLYERRSLVDTAYPAVAVATVSTATEESAAALE